MRAIIASHSGGLRGGAERCVLELAVGLHVHGAVEPIVTTPIRGELSRALADAGVETRTIATPTWLVDPSPPWPHDALRAGRRLKRAAVALQGVPAWTQLLRELRPQVVLTSTTMSPAPALASWRAKIPHIWWIHEFTTLDHDKRYVLGERASLRVIDRLSARVATNSRAVANHYSPPVPPGKVLVVELGVEPPSVDANKPARGTLHVLALGRKTPGKGYEDAIRAVAAVGHRADLKLRIVGPSLGDYGTSLWYLSRDLDVLDRVELLEYVENPVAHLQWSNVVVVPSVAEAFGRVTIEALKSGRPVIGTRAGATTDLVKHGCTGLLVEPGNVAALADAFVELANDPAEVGSMSKHAQLEMQDRFTIRNEVESFETLFRELQRNR
jgi:glycosyltransferase involved in cell wall biosynthesis